MAILFAIGRLGFSSPSRRWLSSKCVTQNLTFYSRDSRNIEIDTKTLRIQEPNGKKLVLLMPWLGVKEKHLLKFVNVYNSLGFDVVSANAKPYTDPKRMLHPLAENLSEFVRNNENYQDIVVHGLSIGALLWSECLVKIREQERFNDVNTRIKAQIWDSITWPDEAPYGIALALFQTNPVFAFAYSYFLSLNFKFNTAISQNFTRIEREFRELSITAPALMFVSKADQIGNWRKSFETITVWNARGISTSWMCYDDCHHVQIMKKHQEEYFAKVINLLKHSKLI